MDVVEDKGVKNYGKTTIGIVGCGRLGILHACLLAEKGFKVTCVDADRAAVEQVSKGKVPFLKQEIEYILQKNLGNGRIHTSYILEDAAQNNVMLITTPATVSEKGKVDYSNIEKVLRRIGSHLRGNMLVINTSVVGVGVTESILKEALESSSGFKLGLDFYFAYSPVPFPKKQTLKSLASCKRVVAAFDKVSLERASNIIDATTAAGVMKSLDVKAAEAAVLFEALRRSVNSALANDFALFCEKARIDYLTVQDLLPLDANVFFPTVGDAENKEALMLLEEAENLNVKIRVPPAALDLDKELLRHGVSLIREALKNCGKSMRRARIAILGVSQTRNMADFPKSMLSDFVKMLETRGAKPSFYDPYLSLKKRHADLPATEKSLAEAVEGVDCIVIFTGHDQFKRLNLKKIKLLVKMPAAVVDFEGVLDPTAVEAEGFVYRGFGRGMWK